ALAHVIADLAPPFLRKGEHRELSDLFASFTRQKGLLYVTILSDQHRVLAHSRIERVGQVLNDPRSIHASEILDFTTEKFHDVEAGGNVIEFVTPIYDGNDRLGTLRIGASQVNGMPYAVRRVGRLAIILPLLLLLVAGTYYLVRRWLRPLHDLRDEFDSLVSTKRFGDVHDKFAGEIGELAEQWNAMMSVVRLEFRDLEREATRLEVGSRLVAYEKKKNEEILDSLPDVVLVTNASGEIVTANRQASLFLHADREKLKGGTLDAALKSTEILKQLDYFSRSSFSNKIKSTLYREPVEGGRTFRFTLAPQTTAQGKLNGYLLMGRDITAQVLSEKMQEDFVASVTHELRSPLTSIKSYIELLMDKEIDDPRTQYEFYNTINDETDRLSRLIDNLLNISKMEAGSLVIDRGPVQMRKLLQDAVRACEGQAAKKEMRLELVMPDTITAPDMDKDLVGVVIVNLLSNAIKYTNNGGEVSVKVDDEENELLIHVHDTGIGIPADALPKLFKKFYRTDQPEVRERVGSGLGLALSKQIAELHGGDIVVKSEIGVGSTFTLVIPKD
ncbi:MAG: PAS domain-containing protein, partial [Myxococcales bacterium]|nr:PAS domain-containing protein [Myxococcales bacterium]